MEAPASSVAVSTSRARALHRQPDDGVASRWASCLVCGRSEFDPRALYPELHDRTALWLTRNFGDVPEEIRTAVRHNAGGHVNRSLFWQFMSPAAGGTPRGALAIAIYRDCGSLEQFKLRFTEAGEALFGSGWIWLVRHEGGSRLRICATSGHDNPMTQGHFPNLVNDVWEHAYYLKYRNRRTDYLRAWWSVVKWEEAARRFGRSDQSVERAWEGEGGFVL